MREARRSGFRRELTDAERSPVRRCSRGARIREQERPSCRKRRSADVADGSAAARYPRAVRGRTRCSRQDEFLASLQRFCLRTLETAPTKRNAKCGSVPRGDFGCRSGRRSTPRGRTRLQALRAAGKVRQPAYVRKNRRSKNGVLGWAFGRLQRERALEAADSARVQGRSAPKTVPGPAGPPGWLPLERRSCFPGPARCAGGRR